MKIVKILLYAVLAILGILLILSLIMPKSGMVERSVLIKAPRAAVWAWVADLKKHEDWSPWKEHDTNMVVNFDGADGQVGQKSSWKGNDKVGEGSQEITELREGELQKLHLHFLKPWENETDVWFTLKDSAEGTAVSWSMNWNMPWPMNAMGAFMSMDKMIGPDFEKGLSKLKTLAESAPAASAFDIKMTDMPARTYWGKQETVSFDKIGDFFSANLPKIFEDVTKAKAEPTGAPCGIFFKWDEKGHSTDMAAAVPAKGFKSSVWKSWDIAAGKAVSLDYYGDYAKTEAAHKAIDKHIADNNLEMNGPVIEEYITDPMTEKDTAKWLTRIWYPVK